MNKGNIGYVIFLIIIISALIPVLSDQINEFATTTIPSLFETSKNWINDVFEKFNQKYGFNKEQ